MLTDNRLFSILKRLPLCTAAFFVATSCSDNAGEKLLVSANGISHVYHIHAPDTAQQAVLGDILLLDLQFRTVDDSLLFHSDELPGKFRIRLAENPESVKPTIDDALTLMKVGDSISFYIDALTFFQESKHVPLPKYLTAGDSLRFSASLKSIEKLEVVEQDAEKLHQRLQFAEDEMIKEYVGKQFDSVEPLASGQYIKIFTQGKGALPQPGDEVGLDYTMSYLNGEVFYSTVDKPEPFVFKMGDGSVIPGLEAGIANLREGSHALLLIPSHLAYGAEGYKIIPPFTPLLFEVKVLEPAD